MAYDASVLLIDDDAVFLQTLSRSLGRKGFSVDIAQNESLAVPLLQQRHYDLVLLDLNLAGESGLTLLDQIKLMCPNQRVVMLTAYASIATAVEAVKKGADNYLCKPINASEIMGLFSDSDIGQDAAIEETPLSVDRLEWEHLQKVLLDYNGNISATARALNMHRRTLQRKLQKRPVQK
mgnify:CR=1 FL=1